MGEYKYCSYIIYLKFNKNFKNIKYMAELTLIIRKAKRNNDAKLDLSAR
jgi:hypothetical protein